LAAEEARLRAEEEARLIAETEARRQAADEQVRLAEARARQQAAEEQKCIDQLAAIRSAAESEAQQQVEKMMRLNQEIEALGKVAAERSHKIQEAEQRLGEAEADSARLEQEHERTMAALAVVRSKSAARSAQRLETEQQLNADIEALDQLEAEQLKRIEDAEAALIAHEEARQAAEAEANRLVREEEERQLELRKMQSDVEVQLQLKAEASKQIKAEVEDLRKAEARRLKEIEKLEARRSQAEAEALKHAELEGQLLAELESIRARVDSNEQSWPEKELSIKAEIEALRKAESIQLKRLEKVEAQLRGQKESGQSTTSQTKAGKVKSGGGKMIATAKETVRRAQEEKSRIALLEALHTETELDIKRRSKKEQQLQAKIHALYQAEVEQLQRLEEETARLRNQEKAISNSHEESEHFAAAIVNDNGGAELLLAGIEESGFDFQAELSKFETDDSPFIAPDVQCDANAPEGAPEEISLTGEDWATSALVESFEDSFAPEWIESVEAPEKSLDLVLTEKGLQLPGHGQSSAMLTEALKSGGPVKRTAALQELAQWDETDAFGLITDLFDDPSAEVRNAAAHALHEFKPDRAASFTRALREASAQRRHNIAAALNGSGLATQAINSLVGEGREKTYDAFSILFLMAKAGEVQTLLETIEKHPDVAVRLSVIRLLTFSNQPDIIPAFRSLAVRGSLPTEVRSAVMEAIYQISSNARDNSLSAA
jgi:hypothetical protein